MIRAIQTAPNVVMVSGMDVSGASYAIWRAALIRMGRALQRGIRAHYENEMTPRFQRFRKNTLKWTLWKERKGYSIKRGQMKRRIVRTLRGGDLFTVSQITPHGSAVITFDEQYLQTLQRHARWYAKQKVPGGLILTLSLREIRRALEWVRVVEERIRVQDEAARKRETQRPITISTEKSGLRVPVSGRRVVTLASTAWRAVAATQARLRLLGRL